VRKAGFEKQEMEGKVEPVRPPGSRPEWVEKGLPRPKPEILEDYTPQEALKDAEFDVGLRGVGQKLAAKYGPVADDTIHGRARSNAVGAASEAEIGTTRLSESYLDKIGREPLDALETAETANPEATGWDFELEKDPSGATLSDAQRAFVTEHAALIDQVGAHKPTKVRQFLGEVRDTFYTDKPLVGGDRGPAYIPHSYNTIGDVLRAVAHYGKSPTEILNRNLAMPRLTDTPSTVPYATRVKSYVRQVASEQALKPVEKAMTEKIGQLQARGLTEEAAELQRYRDKNVMQQASDLDKRMVQGTISKILKEKVQTGDVFDATWKGRAEGQLKVGKKTGEIPTKLGPEDVFEVEINGKTTTMSKTDILAAKYGNTLLNRQPLTRFVDGWNFAGSLMTVAGNIRSGVTGVFSNLARIVSSGRSLEEHKAGVDRYREYLTGKATPEKLREWEEAGIGLQRDDTVEARSRAVELLYTPVQGPDKAAQIIAYEGAKEHFYSTEPSWNEAKVRNQAKLNASLVTDLVTNSTRSPASFDPLYKFAMFLQNSSAREAAQVVRQINNGEWINLAKNVGVRVGTVAAIYKLIDGETDPKKVLGRVGLPLPLSFLIEGRAPPQMIIPQKLGQVASAADVATGQHGRRLLGMKRLEGENADKAKTRWLPTGLQNIAQPLPKHFARDAGGK
jgi:hypothetical protein